MKKRKKKPRFFVEGAYDFAGCDDSNCHLLDCAYGGAKQSEKSMPELIEDVHEVVHAKPSATVVTATHSSPPIIEENRKNREPFNPEKKLFDHLLERYSIRKYGNMPYIRRGYVWLPVSEDVVGALLMKSLSDGSSDIFQSGLADRVAKRIMFAFKFKEDSLVLPKHAFSSVTACTIFCHRKK